KGKGNEHGLKRYLNAFVVILAVMSIGLGIIGYLSADHLLRFLGTPESMMAAATSYLQINFVGMLFLFGYNFISTVLRSLGDSKTPLRFVMIAVALNIVLDPLFIAGFELGIEGAAYATILAQGSAFVYGLVYVLYLKLAPFSIPTLPIQKEVGLILTLGIPSGWQMAVSCAGAAACRCLVPGCGEDVGGGYGRAQRLDSLGRWPAHALGTGVRRMAG